MLVLVASSFALWEFFSMYWPGTQHLGRKIVGLAMGGALVVSQTFGSQWTLLIMAMIVSLLSLGFLVDFGGGNSHARIEHHAPLLQGLVYIPLVLQLALSLSQSEQCLVMSATVATDAGAYYAGTHLGKRKIWPVVSPKKTWAGFAGGIGLCVSVCVAYGMLGGLFVWSVPDLPLWAWGCLGLLLGMTAQFGDFFESALKRSLNVKDSGIVLPGHGGMLDRIDSLLFVLPAYFFVRLTAGSG
jgi:phosphatidate cytidylyltransferase